MKLVIQRVTSASVTVNGDTVGEIGRGLLVFLGVGKDDTRETCHTFAEKLVRLRIFEDENEKINLSLDDVGGELLVVSQFTLYADCKKRRPGFTDAAPPALAEELYEYFITCCKELAPIVRHGRFGAHMTVSLINDGPFTICL